MDDLEWLERWYAEQCDGEWEHQLGVKIETLDNPGWMLTVDLRGTDLDGRAPGVIAVTGEPPTAENGNVGGPKWSDCRVRDGKFIATGDPSQLRKLLAVFRAWASERNLSAGSR